MRLHVRQDRQQPVEFIGIGDIAKAGGQVGHRRGWRGGDGAAGSVGRMDVGAGHPF